MYLTTRLAIALFMGVGICWSSRAEAQKIEGVCFSAPRNEVGDSSIAQVQSIGANWICLMPYAFARTEDAKVRFHPDGGQYWGEMPAGISAMVRMAKARGMKVMLKPHLWLGHGEFTGTYVPDSAIGWKAYEQSYQEYVLYYAKLGHGIGVDLFCIGTEMQAFVQARPIYWNKLIDKVSDAFQGPLTYAANWDEVANFPLWDRMNYIGVDGYFPICAKDRPTVAELEVGWQQHALELARLSTVKERPVLFTEMGYCCTADCAARPWSEDPEAPRDENAQARAWQAFFNVYADKPWYAGCFVWKWFADLPQDEARRGNGFSPQGRAAMNVLRKEFKGQ
ncbi:MAG: hypothetical protein ABIQ75_03335 [Flavobacteriales bacterium]